MGCAGLTFLGMRRPTPSDLGLVGAAAAVTTVLALVDGGHSWADWAFVTIVLTAVALVVRMSWRVYRDAQRERRAATLLQALPAAEAARQAVAVERQRLSRDIEMCVRESLGRVALHAAEAAAAADPTAALRQVQAEAQRANTELRRQLGLLHAGDAHEPVRADAVLAPSPRFALADYLVAAAVFAVAAVDLTAGLTFEDWTWSWAVVAVTLGSAATVVLRRVAPVVGALTCAGLIALGAVIDAPVADGFSFPLTVGILAWSVASLRTIRAWLTVGTLVGVALVSRLLNEPANAPINAVLLAVAVVGGATVGHSRAARAAAQESASGPRPGAAGRGRRGGPGRAPADRPRVARPGLPRGQRDRGPGRGGRAVLAT